MEQKFKVGDRVKCKADSSLVGRVTRFDQCNYAVLWDNNLLTGVDCVWFESELELVQEELEVKETREENGWTQREMVVGVSSVVTPRSSWAGDITLRDQFAMVALTGMIASEGNLVDEGCAFYTPSNAAERAYIFADSMLEARKVKA